MCSDGVFWKLPKSTFRDVLTWGNKHRNTVLFSMVINVIVNNNWHWILTMLFLCCYIVNNNWQCYFHNVIVTKHNVVFVASLLLCMKGSLSFAKLNPPPIYSLQTLLLELPCTWITFPSNEGRSLKGMRGVHPARSRGPKSIPPTHIIRWHASKFVDF